MNRFRSRQSNFDENNADYLRRNWGRIGRNISFAGERFYFRQPHIYNSIVLMEKVAIFISSLNEEVPPKSLSLALQALWYDANGDWERAHDLAQEREDASGNWVHAYLHRKEGDKFNASYWYRRAGKPVCRVSLEEEWEQIVAALLK